MSHKVQKRFGVCACLLALAALVGVLALSGQAEAVDKKKAKKARALTRGKLKVGTIRPNAPVTIITQEGMLCEDTADNSGSRIRAIRQDSAAFNAGLEKGDVVFGVEDQRVSTTADFESLLESARSQGMADVVLSVIDVSTGQATLVPLPMVLSSSAAKKKLKR